MPIIPSFRNRDMSKLTRLLRSLFRRPTYRERVRAAMVEVNPDMVTMLERYREEQRRKRGRDERSP